MLRWEFLFFTRGAHDPSIQTCARKYFSLELIIRNFTDCLKRDEIPKCTLECCTGTIRPGMCTYLFYSVREVICHPESRQQAHKLRPLDPCTINFIFLYSCGLLHHNHAVCSSVLTHMSMNVSLVVNELSPWHQREVGAFCYFLLHCFVVYFHILSRTFQKIVR